LTKWHFLTQTESCTDGPKNFLVSAHTLFVVSSYQQWTCFHAPFSTTLKHTVCWVKVNLILATEIYKHMTWHFFFQCNSQQETHIVQYCIMQWFDNTKNVHSLSQEWMCNNWQKLTMHLLSLQQCCTRLCLCECMSHCTMTAEKPSNWSNKMLLTISWIFLNLILQFPNEEKLGMYAILT
jgi:hypothetical protein